jgi:hypothetical protein
MIEVPALEERRWQVATHKTQIFQRRHPVRTLFDLVAEQSVNGDQRLR